MEQDEPIDDDSLAPSPTLTDYIDQLYEYTGNIIEVTRDLPCHAIIDDITYEIDKILVEMRHADWRHEIG